MSKYKDGCYGSIPGIALIGKVLAGRCTMHYTRVAVGKGAIPEGETPKTMTEPADYVMDARISGVTNPVDGECQITVQINSADVEAGFYCTGLLLYEQDPDEGEVPYTYLVLENEPEWIRPASSIVGKLATFDIIAAVGDVDTVTAAIDPDAFATVGETKKMVEEEVAKHPGGGYSSILTTTLPASGWMDAPEPSEDHNFICDVVDAGVTKDLAPVGTCLPGYFSIADKAGVLCGCDTFDGFIRFYSKRKPAKDIQAIIILFAKGNGSGGGGDVDAGDGLEYRPDGKLAVKIGYGLSFDGNRAVAADKQAVVTDTDLLNEGETAAELEEILTK